MRRLSQLLPAVNDLEKTMSEIALKPGKSNKVKESTFYGVWESYDGPNNRRFREFKSHIRILGVPLIGIAGGFDPDTKKMAQAHGVIAIGQRARGFLAIGQFVNGYVSIGQFATGRIAALGQFVVAPIGIGQFSIGVAALGQSGIAGWGIFQQGLIFFDGLGQNLMRILG